MDFGLELNIIVFPGAKPNLSSAATPLILPVGSAGHCASLEGQGEEDIRLMDVIIIHTKVLNVRCYHDTEKFYNNFLL